MRDRLLQLVAQGMTKKGLGELAGVSEGVLNRLLTNDLPVSVISLGALSRFLEGKRPLRQPIRLAWPYPERLTVPVVGYRDIECQWERGNGQCWKACGLWCAPECIRFPDRICRGCPCEKGGDK